MKAILALADGRVFHGVSRGISGTRVGELVFNTSMTGYQEVMTDPSYASQIVTFTYPMFGNVGINLEDAESQQVHAVGIVVRTLCQQFSNWRAHISVAQFFQRQHVVAISDVDTRSLTHHLRQFGAQNACITTELTSDEAIEAAKKWVGISNGDLTQRVTCASAYQWQDGPVSLDKANRATLESPKFVSAQAQAGGDNQPAPTPLHVVVYDLGVKHSILRCLVGLGTKVTVVPANTLAEAVMDLKPDGVVFSNGPGDPRQCQSVVTQLSSLMTAGYPILGICLGCQLLGLALGGEIVKMKFGHHGANHPVSQCVEGGIVITSQNHGFMLDEASLPSSVVITHRSLFDNSIQGISMEQSWGYQGHPESGPGPHDWKHIFNNFLRQIQKTRKGSDEL